MPWQNLQGHDALVERFRRAALRGRLAGSFLFVGPSGIGKRLFALALAKGILCKGNGEQSIDPCGHCESCRLFGPSVPGQSEEQRSSEFLSPHPDLYFVSKPPDKSMLPLELLIGDKDHRGHSGLCFNISRTPFLGHRKVAIIDDADYLNAEGANSLLKTLEEPPPDSVLILIGTATTKQLPTIRSRCQIIRFAPLSSRLLATLLMEQGMVSTLEQGLRLAERGGGSLDQARELIDDKLDGMREELVRMLSAKPFHSVALAQRLNEFVEAVGKEAPAKRRRLRALFSLVVDHFREKIKKSEAPVRSETGAATEERHQTATLIAVKRLERTFDALEQINRNVNLPYIIDAWASDLR